MRARMTQIQEKIRDSGEAFISSWRSLTTNCNFQLKRLKLTGDAGPIVSWGNFGHGATSVKKSLRNHFGWINNV